MGAAPAHSLVVLLTVLTGGRTLLLRDSIDRPVRLYRAPTPYYREGRPALSSVIITSQPLDFNSTTTSTTTAPPTSRPQWRRHSNDDVTEDSSRMPLTRVKTVDFVTNSRRFSDFKNSDHKNSDYKIYDHKNSDYKTSDHMNSDYRTSEHKNSDYKTPDHKNSDYMTSEHKNSDYKTPDHKNSDYMTSENKNSDYRTPDHKNSDYMTSEHKNSDYKTPDHKNSDYMTSDHKNSDYNNPDQKIPEYITPEHKNSDYMNPDYKNFDNKNTFKTYDNKRYDYKEYKKDLKSSDLKQADPRTTESTHANVKIPFYNFECRKGETCSETINLELSTQSPTFKPYPQELLDKFLKDYTMKRQDGGSQDKLPPRSLTRYNDRELIEPIEQPTNRLANLYLESDEPLEAETSDEKPSWDLVPSEKHNHPYDDRDGWITLEPVPWSNSKVSKWHSLVKPSKRPPWDDNQNQRPSRPPKPWDNANQWDSKPPYEWDGERPTKPWDNDKPSKPWDERPTTKPWEDKPFYKPWEDKPGKPWEERPTKPWENDRPHKPSWDNDKPSRPSVWDQDHQRPTHTWASNSDIITSDTRPHSSSSGGSSGRPQHWGTQAQSSGYKPNKWASTSDLITADDGSGQWPGAHKPHEGQHHHQQPQPNHQPWPRPHPPNHPEAGPGEWVLLSSTKGYSLPSRSRSRQRAMTLMTSAPVNTKRTVRLTVLPADPANSATSHGGMLEVEKTFQTVDESRERDRISRYQAGKLTEKDAATISEAISKLNVTVVPNHHVHINITDEKSAQQAAAAPVNVNPDVQKQELVQEQSSTTFVRSQDNRRTATLAAIGAGMLPATMALLVPMMLGRKKREVEARLNNTRAMGFNQRAY